MTALSDRYTITDPTICALGMHGEYLWKAAWPEPGFHDLLARVGLSPIHQPS